MNNKKGLILSGALVGVFAILLSFYGNPKNMAICVACFLRDTAGAIGLHRAGVVQYIRPEILGFVLGSFILSVLTKEFKPRGGSSPIIRFVMGAFVMIGALVFLGCPLRMVLRLANGDLNALVGLAGFTSGIFIGIQFLKKGFTLGRNYPQPKVNGYVFPGLSVGLFFLLVTAPAFIFFSVEGPGAARAPIALALIAGLAVGVMAQRSRLCMAGGIRDIILIKDTQLLSGFLAIFVVALIGNLTVGFENFNFGFANQPIAHTEWLWNYLGLLLVGFGSVLLGGCPLRQMILTGEGDTDAGLTVLGLIAGAAFAHNFGLAASPAGVPVNGKIAVVLGIVLMAAIGIIIILSERSKIKVSGEGVKVGN